MKNIRISTTAWVFVIALVISGGLLAVSSMITIDNISTIKQTWDRFEESRSEKAASLSALRKEIGYGGMIHQFKNFVLRHGEERIGIVNAKLGGAASAIARYRALGLSELERKAIDDIQEMLDSYSRALSLTVDLIDQGKSPTEIDDLVRINDLPALEGLDILDAEVTRISGSSTLKPSKSHDVAILRKAMGYGGMIHNFKNALLRLDQQSEERTSRDIVIATKVIEQYTERRLSDNERSAIRDIAGVLKAYDVALSTIYKLSEQGMSTVNIDHAVQIDDTPALRGFDVLTKEIVRQNLAEATKVNEALALVASVSETSAIVTLVVISLLIFASLWLIRTQITNPIERMTGVMTKLAAGDLDLEVHSIKQNNEIGEMARAVEIFRNTAIEREHAEVEINQFKTTLDRTQDCIFMFRPDTLKYFYVNQGAIDQVGHTKEKLFEMTPVDIKPEYDELKYRKLIQPLIDGPQRMTTFETLHQSSTGELIPVEIFLQYIAPENEEPRFVAIIRDITERRKVDKAKSEFISTVSHELRTPLTSIKGALALIQAGSAGQLPDKLQSMLDIAYNNSNRLVLLINDILDIEKISAGKMDFHMVQMDVVHLVEEAIQANHGYGDEHGITFVQSGIDTPSFVMGDENRLMQVLSNLMSNAAKFSPDGDEVELSVLNHEGGIRISVKDNGPGIPEEFREHLFDKFSQADSSDTRQKGGTGLGLNITKAIIEQHHGVIGFETETGKGSTFFVDLPLMLVQSSPLPLKTRPSETSPESHRILICEDEADVATILEQMLGNEGYLTSTASTAAQAKQLLEEGDYDAMTLDLGLPDQDGLSLMKELRMNPKTQNLPVIVVSATAREGQLQLNGDAVGVIDWLEKPIDEQRLTDLLGNALEKKSGAKPRILHIEDDESIFQVISTLVEGLADVIAATTLAEGVSCCSREPLILLFLI